MPDRILLRGIRFHGHHGVDSHERDVGQWYRVDLDLYVDLRSAGLTDDLSRSLDYGEVCRRVMEVGTQRSVLLIETLAELICEAILAEFPATRVCVRVTKTPPAELVAALAGLGTLESSAVEIERSRNPSGVHGNGDA